MVGTIKIFKQICSVLVVLGLCQGIIQAQQLRQKASQGVRILTRLSGASSRALHSVSPAIQMARQATISPAMEYEARFNPAVSNKIGFIKAHQQDKAASQNQIQEKSAPGQKAKTSKFSLLVTGLASSAMAAALVAYYDDKQIYNSHVAVRAAQRQVDVLERRVKALETQPPVVIMKENSDIPQETAAPKNAESSSGFVYYTAGLGATAIGAAIAFYLTHH